MPGRLVIAGTHSGVGKTTVTVGLIAALRRRCFTVQPFKVGPDYIDPTYHTLAAGRGRACRNLDTWMVPAERVCTLFARAAADADIAIVEGVMGLYDGVGYDSDAGSTAEVAKLLTAPVILVLDAAKVARSAAAVALGYLRFDNATPIAGFIVNNVANENHGRGIAEAIKDATGLSVLGWLPREAMLRVPERHLGLIPTHEPGRWLEFTQAAGDVVVRHVDVDRLLSIGKQAPCLARHETLYPTAYTVRLASRPVIAVARDEAFHFTYEDNLELLRDAGAEISLFSPLRDSELPPRTAGIILSGGFPEVYGERLAANRQLHAAIRAAHWRQIPIYAECGGLMYLTEAILDKSGNSHAMVGLLPGRCVMDRLTLGYRIAQSTGDSWLLRDGEVIRGHEFHHSIWENRPCDLPPAYRLLPRSAEGTPKPEGARLGSVHASYVHIHLATKPYLAERFVAACRAAAGGDV